ncbi:MAG: hypothetical protein KDB22_16090, partial [Planctomycetales bacterium]|nr:hypothetical protein [Planctomycetales bacterium]
MSNCIPTAEINGRICWNSLLCSYVKPMVLLATSIVAAIWSLAGNFRGSFIAAGFALLVATSSLLSLAIHMLGVVTSFRMSNGTLEFTRLGRGLRRVALAEIVGVLHSDSMPGEVGFWLRDGTTLTLPLLHLRGGSELVTELQRHASVDNRHIEGFLGRQQIASVLVYQWCVSCILAAIAVPACFSLAIGIVPKNQISSPLVFLALGVVLLTLCGVLFYYAVLSYWLGCVRSFRWDGRCLEYRTVFSAVLQQRLADEVEQVSAKRPFSRQEEAGSWRLIRFRDGTSIKLQLGILHNAESLFLALKAETLKHPRISLDLPKVDHSHPLWSAVEPYLEDGEAVIWLGKPVYGKLWSEMPAEFVFGCLLAAAGGGAVVLVTT